MKPFAHTTQRCSPEADSGDEENAALPGRAWVALLLAASAQQPPGNGRRTACTRPSISPGPSPASSASAQPLPLATASPSPEPAFRGQKRAWTEVEASPPAVASAGKRRRPVSPLLLAALCRSAAAAGLAQECGASSGGLAAHTPNLTGERRQPLAWRPAAAASHRPTTGAFVPLRASSTAWPPPLPPPRHQPRPRHLHTALRLMLAPLPPEDAERLEEARRFLARF